MSSASSVQYLQDKTGAMELILCRNSNISYPPHNHVSVFAIGLILSGSLVLTVDDRVRLYQANDTFVISPYLPHTINSVHPYTLLTLCMNKYAVARFGKETLKNKIRRMLISVPGLRLSEPQTMQFIDSIDRITGYSEPHCMRSCIDIVKDRLERFPERQISIEEMAHTTYLSKYHFIRSFQQTVGLTPHRFQIQNRIRKAQRLLYHTADITEVALTSGFYDQSHFIRHFKNYTGLTPAAYQSSCRLLPENTANLGLSENTANSGQA